MSTATIETTTLTRVAGMPRVNLLPPEIAEAAKVRTLRLAVIGAAAAAVVGVGMLYLGAAAQANAAADDLATAQAQTAVLNSKVAEFADVPKVYAQVADAQLQLTQAMGQEVRYSYLLNDLSLTIPNRVWLTNVTIDQPLAPVSPDGTVTAGADSTVTGTYGTPGVATVTTQGYAMSVNDVAAWLDSLTTQPFYADPTFTSATKEEVADSGTTAVKTDSQVTVTAKAYSDRYTKPAGS